MTENVPNTQKEEVLRYLKEKKVVELMKRLVALLVLNQPSDPQQFIIDTLKQSTHANQNSSSTTTHPTAVQVFNDQDIDVMFDIMSSECQVDADGADSSVSVSGSVSLSMSQVIKYLQGMGINVDTTMDKSDAGEVLNRTKFKQVVKEYLNKYA